MLRDISYLDTSQCIADDYSSGSNCITAPTSGFDRYGHKQTPVPCIAYLNHTAVAELSSGPLWVNRRLRSVLIIDNSPPCDMSQSNKIDLIPVAVYGVLDTLSLIAWFGFGIRRARRKRDVVWMSLVHIIEEQTARSPSSGQVLAAANRVRCAARWTVGMLIVSGALLSPVSHPLIYLLWPLCFKHELLSSSVAQLRVTRRWLIVFLVIPILLIAAETVAIAGELDLAFIVVFPGIPWIPSTVVEVGLFPGFVFAGPPLLVTIWRISHPGARWFFELARLGSLTGIVAAFVIMTTLSAVNPFAVNPHGDHVTMEFVFAVLVPLALSALLLALARRRCRSAAEVSARASPARCSRPALIPALITARSDTTAAVPSPSAGRFTGAARTLILGEPRDAALGVAAYLGIEGHELAKRMAEGTRAIVREFEEHGTDEEKDYLRHVLEGVEWVEDEPGAEPRQVRLADFVAHPRSIAANLAEAHVLALRLYTTPCFKGINDPLRQYHGRLPHPFPCTVTFISDGIKFLRAADERAAPVRTAEPNLPRLRPGLVIAGTVSEPMLDSVQEAPPLPPASRMGALRDWIRSRCCRRAAPVGEGGDVVAIAEQVYWRGMRDLVLTKQFLAAGGSELAPMSATTSLDVAVRYCMFEEGSSKSGVALLFRVVASNIMQRGASLEYLSTAPGEEEYLYPPLTYLKPTGAVTELQAEGVVYTIVDVVPHFPS